MAYVLIVWLAACLGATLGVVVMACLVAGAAADQHEDGEPW